MKTGCRNTDTSNYAGHSPSTSSADALNLQILRKKTTSASHFWLLKWWTHLWKEKLLLSQIQPWIHQRFKGRSQYLYFKGISPIQQAKSVLYLMMVLRIEWMVIVTLYGYKIKGEENEKHTSFQDQGLMNFLCSWSGDIYDLKFSLLMRCFTLLMVPACWSLLLQVLLLTTGWNFCLSF